MQALEVGPDYEGVAMTRRILEASRGVIVHSRFMVDQMRAAGYTGPIARIPHGAWIPEADRLGYRHRLGLDEIAPLIGIFGFLKPYKRIAESLRAFRRLVRVKPEARMILVGEPHPDFPIQALIRSLELSAHVRVLGFAELDDFVGYMAACDIVLNLRYPTVGESSGSLLRALGLGKAVMVSDVGSFREFPDDVCLKVPVGAGEEDILFEYLNLLTSRPDVAQALGGRARCFVERECSWDLVAARYAAFLQAVVEGRDAAETPEAPVTPPEAHGTGGSPRRARISGSLVAHRALPGVSGNAQDAPGADARNHAAGRPCRPHPGNGRVPPNHARAALAIGVRRGARLLLWTRGARWTAARSPRNPARSSLRHRSVRCREGPLPLCGRLLFHRALLRADRAPVRRPDAPDVGSEPDPQAGGLLCADHAQHRGAARDRGDPAGLSPRLLPRLHPAVRSRRSGGAAQSRIHAARSPESDGEFRLHGHAARNRPVPRRAAPAGRAGWCTCSSATAFPRNCAATASTRSAKRRGRCASAIPAGCIHERLLSGFAGTGGRPQAQREAARSGTNPRRAGAAPKDSAPAITSSIRTPAC